MFISLYDYLMMKCCCCSKYVPVTIGSWLDDVVVINEMI
jgi:hypothetical protein